MKTIKSKFTLGQILSTSGVVNTIDLADVQAAVQRHAVGDWGIVSEGDRAANDEDLKAGGQLLSAYLDRNGVKFWIITEANRQTTTILLPDEW